MRGRPVFIFGLLLLQMQVFSQVRSSETALLQKLDSIRNSSCISRHFADLYFSTTKKAVEFSSNKPAAVKIFIERLETSFAALFFRSIDSFAKRSRIPGEWKNYFDHDSLSAIQYKLLGINAHINGDIWQALVTAFTLEEIENGKKSYFDFQQRLKKQYLEFYRQSLETDPRIRLLHSITGGFDKLYGQFMLKHWRKRQMKLAILYYKDKEKFNQELEKLHRKMDRINQLVLRNL